MAIYYFDTDDGARTHRDHVGISLDSVDASQDEARSLVIDLMHGVATRGRSRVTCVVRDEIGKDVYRMTIDVRGEVETAASLVAPTGVAAGMAAGMASSQAAA